MIALNHALTGAAIMLAGGGSALLFPVALLSHFILDAIPHFGFHEQPGKYSKNFSRLLVVDALSCFIFVLLLVSSGLDIWPSVIAGAFLAASPDFMWASGYFRVKRGMPESKDSNSIKRFHSRIQWSQTPSGAIVEIAWLLIFSYLVIRLIF